MPELPEVETVRRGLELCLVGKTIVDGSIPVPKLLKPPMTDPAQFLDQVRGLGVQNVRRRGKHLIFGLSNGYALVSHLKMRGHMRVLCPGQDREQDTANGKYLCIVLDLDDGSRFEFRDIWGWGEMRLVPDDPGAIEKYVPALATMGVEPLSEDFTAEELRRAALRHPKTTIKACLLNQDVVAGVGNIYADESLHRAKIKPQRLAGDLSEAEWASLHREIRSVLQQAVVGQGTVSDNFFDTQGRPGKYVPRVYDRADLPCLECGATLVRTKVAGRGTVYCPSCQL